MVLPLFVFLKHSASQTGYQGGGHESRLPANEGYVFTLCSMRFALCFTEMALDRLEECLQAVVTGTHPRTIER
jgi:hypothetical protein